MDYFIDILVDRIKFAREAADVRRTHCSHGLTVHTVGGHTFNMLTLLLILYPDASGNLLRAVIQHDIPERVTGDMPHPAKMAGIVNKDKQTHVEIHINQQVFGDDTVQQLTEDEVKWLSGLDMLEFYCWVRDEISMGNVSYTTKLEAVHNYMSKYAHKYPTEILDAFHEIKLSKWHRMPDIGGE